MKGQSCSNSFPGLKIVITLIQIKRITEEVVDRRLEPIPKIVDRHIA
jgi:hypothetical protein